MLCPLFSVWKLVDCRFSPANAGCDPVDDGSVIQRDLYNLCALG